MITKEEITIKVSSEVAEAYRNATEEERKQLQLKIAAIIQSQFTSTRSHDAFLKGYVPEDEGLYDDYPSR